MTALAPCPICQGPAELWRHNEEPPRKSWCACMGRCAVLISSEYKTDEEAIAAWNTRARTPLEAELLEALAFYADENQMRPPSEGPWGVNSTDFGRVAGAAIAKAKANP